MSKLSEKTLATYKSIVNSIYRNIGLGKSAPVDDAKWIPKHFKQIVDYIDNLDSVHTQKNNYAVMKTWCNMFDVDDEKIIKTLDERMSDLAESVNASYATNKMNEKIEKNWVGVEQMREKVEYLKSKLPDVNAIDTYREYIQLMKYLCLLIHIEVPLRNDLADAKLVKELPADQDDEVNYLVIKKNMVSLHLNNYKTRKEYGAKVIQFSKELSRIIIYYSETINRMSPDGWFIGKNNENAPISRPTYTKMINSIFSKDGVKVGSTQIRRAVVSDLYKVDEDEMKKKQELANVMSHSVATAGLVYAKHIPDSKK